MSPATKVVPGPQPRWGTRQQGDGGEPPLLGDSGSPTKEPASSLAVNPKAPTALSAGFGRASGHSALRTQYRLSACSAPRLLEETPPLPAMTMRTQGIGGKCSRQAEAVELKKPKTLTVCWRLRSPSPQSPSSAGLGVASGDRCLPSWSPSIMFKSP